MTLLPIQIATSPPLAHVKCKLNLQPHVCHADPVLHMKSKPRASFSFTWPQKFSPFCRLRVLHQNATCWSHQSPCVLDSKIPFFLFDLNPCPTSSPRPCASWEGHLLLLGEYRPQERVLMGQVPLWSQLPPSLLCHLVVRSRNCPQMPLPGTWLGSRDAPLSGLSP